ncbi:glycoprotein endo-alpha-1,2-mannosidase-like protein [Diprion similis]|uniref:glycoprotein endo-alpha-1,2-mannosidase-like protein n=1 Tax=Diprion similis TaxID=362088 RepID=UPI001EF7EEE7|nr:glycoprotein endo-alpha-1,2-mannosidase-like protein [Diprion similis]
MFGSVVTALSLRRCFYLSAIVVILSTLMAAVIIVKLSPLESVKCQPHMVTSPVEWSTLSSQGQVGVGDLIIAVHENRSRMQELNDKSFGEMRHKMVRNKVARISNRMRKKIMPLINWNSSIETNYNVHIFYYPWYRSLEFDKSWKHWNHDYLPNWKKNDKRVFPDGKHEPPDDIGANYYPSLGCYSSRDPQVIDLHMKQLKETGVGVVVVSWIPPNAIDSTDSVMSDLLDAAHRYSLKVAPHIEPYAGRNPINLIEHLKYLFSEYGKHPALHRIKRETDGAVLPVMYIYDSYVFPSNSWWELLSDRGNLTLRGSEIDAVYMGLLVDAQHKNHIKKSHFDGFYTYFATNEFSFGSSWKNWRDLNKFAEQNELLFIPSVGPGYIDTQVRPWNAHNTRHRRHGQYYDYAWSSAINSGATTVSITSFNEWHEGTQIEPARPASNEAFTYLDYEPEGPNLYLNLTKHYVEQFTKKYKNAKSND